MITADVGDDTILTSSNDSGNRWFLGGAAIPDATGQSFTVNAAGSYTVQTTIDDCPSEISEPLDIIVTGLSREISGGMMIYPNPAHSELFVELKDDDQSSVTFEIFDALGSRVSTTNGLTNSPTRISMEDRAPGMYFLKASTGERVHTTRVVKR